MIKYRGNNDSSDDDGDSKSQNVIIDVGKTFREGVVRWFPEHNIESVDAILLTHGHADAFFGLDDVRSVMDRNASMPVYLSDVCRKRVQEVFDYMFPELNPDRVEKRHVSKIDWHRINEYEAFSPIDGLEFLPVPVKHGEDMDCMGFIFGRQDVVVYLSDISRMLDKTMKAIKARKRISLLVVDALHPTREYFSHFTMEQAVDLAREIRADKTLLVGMSSAFEHERDNVKLSKLLSTEGLDVQLARDGLSLPMQL
jgi:phosphoribosyl 1,2-cyclic phosphodiesterase